MPALKFPLKLAQFPRVITSDHLMARKRPGDSVVKVWMSGPSVAPFLFGGRTQKQFLFVWDKKALRHVLQCPVSVWNEGMAQEVLDQLRLSYPLIVTFHLAAVARVEQVQAEETPDVEPELVEKTQTSHEETPADEASAEPVKPEEGSTKKRTQRKRR